MGRVARSSLEEIAVLGSAEANDGALLELDASLDLISST